jgi:hypothetical protein
LNRKPVRPSREIYRQFTSPVAYLGSNFGALSCCPTLIDEPEGNGTHPDASTSKLITVRPAPNAAKVRSETRSASGI